MADPVTDARVARVQQLLSQFSTWIDKYRGGVPRAFAATIMMWESDGNFNAPGDPSLGETGYYQIASYVPTMFGMDVSATQDPESNVCIGLLEYQYEAVRWHLLLGDAVPVGSADSYKLARLTFAIGRGGATQLAAMAGATDRGDVYGQIARYIAANGAPSFGSQTSDVVAKRVADIATQWGIADLAGANNPGPPTLVPDPPAGPYTIPPDAAPFFRKPLPSVVVILGSLGVLAYALWKRRQRRS